MRLQINGYVMQVDTDSKREKKHLTKLKRSLLILSIICDPTLTYRRLQEGAIYQLKYVFNDPSASQVNTALCRNQINWVFKFIIMVGS